MVSSYSPIEVDLIANLKTSPVADGTVVLLVGGATLTDGLGGFYRFDASSTAAEDTRFWNVVASNVSSTGRWMRIFQRVRPIAGGYLVSNGGFKQFYMPITLGAGGQATVYLTMDGTATGAPMFSEVWTTTGDGAAAGSSANDAVIGSRKSLSADLKTLVYQFVRGSSVTVGLLGVVVPGLTAAPSGTAVVIAVSGV